MAVIETNSVESKTGYKKKLDAKAEQVILNIVQVNLYAYPFKSMVRELCSNCLDSLREKRMAINILNGTRKESDYFVQKEGELYEDSQFDPTYYKPQHFDVLDIVTLKYINNHTENRDLFTIKDSGVGLGNKRLEKFFTPGYSSKRLNIDALGSYGLGSKSPLSTLIESYRVISIYEGKKFMFDVYVDKVDSIISKFDADGTINDYIEFDVMDNKGNKMLVYYTKTAEPNGVEIQVEVKRHNKDQIIESIKSQLMYFKENIEAYDVYGDRENRIEFKAKILFENDDIILSDSNYFSRPHFVLKGVNYGLIDFRELDLDSRLGNLGIKVDMSTVDVNPSRESIGYTSKTRATILSKYEKVTQQVTEMLNAKLKADNFLNWISNANSIYHTSSNVVEDKIINSLSKFIDKSQLDLTFKKDDFTAKYSPELKEMFSNFLKFERISLERSYNYTTGQNQYKIKRETIAYTANLPKKDIYAQFTETDTRKNQYILKEIASSFLVVRPSFLNKEMDEAVSKWINKEKGALLKTELLDYLVKEIDRLHPDAKQASTRKVLIASSLKAINALDFLISEKSLPNILDVKVPEAFEYKEDDYTDVELNEIKTKDRERYKQIIEQRKKDSLFVIKTVQDSGTWSSNYKTTTFEIKKENLPSSEIYYATGDLSEEFVNLASFIDTYSKKRTNNGTDGTASNSTSGHLVAYNEDVVLLMVAQNNLKYVNDERHINDFGMIFTQDNKLTTYDYIKKGLLVNYLHELFKSKSIAYDKIDTAFLGTLYPRITPIVKLMQEKKITSDRVAQVNNAGLTNLYKAFDVQMKMLLNPELDEVEVDDLMVEALGIDIVDNINGLDLIDTTVLEDVKYAIDFLKIFGVYITNDIYSNKNLTRLFFYYMDKHKSLLTLEHEDLK